MYVPFGSLTLRIDILSGSQGCLVCVCVCVCEWFPTYVWNSTCKGWKPTWNVSLYQKPMYVIRIYVLIFYMRWTPLMDAINGRIYTYQKPTWTLIDVSTYQNLCTSLMTNAINGVYTWTLMDVSTYQKLRYVINDECHWWHLLMGTNNGEPVNWRH